MERGDPETGQRSTQLLLVGLSLVDDNKVISRCRDSAGSIVEYSPHSLHAELSSQLSQTVCSLNRRLVNDN